MIDTKYKIPSEMEVAPRFKLLSLSTLITLLTMLILFTLLTLLMSIKKGATHFRQHVYIYGIECDFIEKNHLKHSKKANLTK